MAKNEFTFLLQDYSAEIQDNCSLSFSCSYEVDGLPATSNTPVEFQLSAYKDNTLIYNSQPTLTVLDRDYNLISDACYFDFDEDNLPNYFVLRFRFFSGGKSFSISPTIPNKKGSAEITAPEKSLLGRSKWAIGGFSVNSVNVKNDDGDFNVEWSASAAKQGNSVIRVSTVSGSDQRDFESLIKSPILNESLLIDGSNKLSMEFQLFEAEKWDSVSIFDVEFIKSQNDEDDDYQSEDESVLMEKYSDERDAISQNTSDINWQEVGEKAFYKYFRIYDKFIDHDQAQELATDEIHGAMADAGISEYDSWYEDLPTGMIIEIGLGFMKKFNGIEKEVGYEINPDCMGPMHTWISDLLYYAEEDENWPKLKKMLEVGW